MYIAPITTSNITLPPVKPTILHSSDKMMQLRDTLNKAKHGIEQYNKIWYLVQNKTNEYEYLRGNRGILTTKYHFKYVTNAFMKIWELLHTFVKFNENTPEIKSFHVAEAPGAFIVALQRYVSIFYKNTKLDWYAETLHPSINVALKDEYNLIRDNPTRWIYGIKGDGDVTNIENIPSFEKQIGKVDIVTGDIKIESNDYDNEEEDNFVGYLGQLLTCLYTLREGGVMIIKGFTFFRMSSISLLYFLSLIFGQVYITKPLSSRYGNTEQYIVGINYKSCSVEYLNDILKYMKEYKNPDTSMYAEIPKVFVNEMNKILTQLIQNTIKAIQLNTFYAKKYLENSAYKFPTMHKEQEWLKLYPVLK